MQPSELRLPAGQTLASIAESVKAAKDKAEKAAKEKNASDDDDDDDAGGGGGGGDDDSATDDAQDK